MSGLAPPTPYQWNVGDVGSAALLNAQLYTGLTYLLNPPMFEAVQTATTTSVTSSTSWTALPFSDAAGIITDTYTGYSASTPTRYTAQVAGWYWVCGCVCWASSSTGNRGIRLTKNGSPVQGGGTIIGGAAASQDTAIPSPVRKVFLNGTGDYVELNVMQNSGATLATAFATDVSSSFSVFFAHL